MKKWIPLFFISFFFIHLIAFAQNTVGLLSNDVNQAYDGYNLIYPHNQSTVFLLDNCGEIVHKWEDDVDLRPGNMAYILENGNLVKCKRMASSAVNDRIWAGGGGETVELRTWDNELLASFTLNNDTARLHHDIAPLPNGNVLMIAWDLKTGSESLEAGRDTSELSHNEIWSEKILEWNPATNEIVWEWSVWDHLVQDFDRNRINFGVVADHPELININYDEHAGHPDWLHINSIAYNPVLDQIALSVPYFNELWVIDHSTTTEEAAGHTGGNSGKGGDLLYRWGNPLAYNQGTVEDKQLFFQHDVHWINPMAQEGDKYFGHIGLFNNRVAENISTGNIINSNFDGTTNNYELMDGAFLPLDFDQTFMHPDIENMPRAASRAVSSFQVLPNDNVLLCAGRDGYSYEITPDNEVVWEYITPLIGGLAVEQGDTTVSAPRNLTFRINRYAKDYTAFADKDLTSKGFIELNPNTAFCGLMVGIDELSKALNLQIYPNPASHQLIIDKNEGAIEHLQLHDLSGKFIQDIRLKDAQTIIPIHHLAPGLYFLKSREGAVAKVVVF
jgi:hypothetical protein